MRALRLLIVGPVIVATAASIAGAVQVRPHYGVVIQAVYDRNGNPLLGANFSPDGALAKPRWSICAPPTTSVCKPVAGSSQELTPGATAPGTVFKAIATYRGTTYAAISAMWKGQLHALRRPGLGEPRVGVRVSPTRATWQGGWKAVGSYHSQLGAQSGGRAPAIDQLSVEACRTRSGAHCLNLSPVAVATGDTGAAVRIGSRFKGWYLFAFDQHFSGDTAFATPAYGKPQDVPTLRVGPTVARSRPYGPVS